MIFDTNESFIHKIGLLSRGNNLELQETEQATQILNECIKKLHECKTMLDDCTHESLNECKYRIQECMKSTEKSLNSLTGCNESLTKLESGFLASKDYSVFTEQLKGLIEGELNCDLKNGNLLSVTKNDSGEYMAVLRDNQTNKDYRYLDLYNEKDIVVYLKRNKYFTVSDIV